MFPHQGFRFASRCGGTEITPRFGEQRSKSERIPRSEPSQQYLPSVFCGYGVIYQPILEEEEVLSGFFRGDEDFGSPERSLYRGIRDRFDFMLFQAFENF